MGLYAHSVMKRVGFNNTVSVKQHQRYVEKILKQFVI